MFPVVVRIPLDLGAVQETHEQLPGEPLRLPTLGAGWACWRREAGHRPFQVFCEREATRLEVWVIPYDRAADEEQRCRWDMQAYEEKPYPWLLVRQVDGAPGWCGARWRKRGALVEARWVHDGNDLFVVRAETRLPTAPEDAALHRRWLEGVQVGR